MLSKKIIRCNKNFIFFLPKIICKRLENNRKNREIQVIVCITMLTRSSEKIFILMRYAGCMYNYASERFLNPMPNMVVYNKTALSHCVIVYNGTALSHWDIE